MDIRSLLSPDRIYCGNTHDSRKRVFETLSTLIADEVGTLQQSEVVHLFTEREQLGTTSIGKGVAIPHARTNLVKKPIAALVSIDAGVEFDAVDKKPVDLFFGFLIPEEDTGEHLEILSALAAMFNEKEVRNKLREAKDSQEIFSILIHYHG